MTNEEKIKKMQDDLHSLIIGHQRIVNRFEQENRTLKQQVNIWKSRAEKLEKELQMLQLRIR